MQYIDKSISPNNGAQIVDNLLSQCWINSEYKDANYGTLSKPEFRVPFVDVLLQEQNSFCCYCMKLLENNHKTTLEHIIPQKVDIVEFNKYLDPILTINVIHKEYFDKKTNIIPPDKYPHDIAYHNLVASCDSKSNCNNFRKNNLIIPFFYDSNIENKIEYDNEGNTFNFEYFDYLELTGISTSAELIIFRKIWYELSKVKNDSDDITDEDILEVVASMELEKRFERKLNDFWDSPSKRPELLKFKWFFQYYKQQKNTH